MGSIAQGGRSHSIAATDSSGSWVGTGGSAAVRDTDLMTPGGMAGRAAATHGAIAPKHHLAKPIVRRKPWPKSKLLCVVSWQYFLFISVPLCHHLSSALAKWLPVKHGITLEAHTPATPRPHPGHTTDEA